MGYRIQGGSAKKQAVVFTFKVTTDGARASYRFFFGIASMQSDGTHLSAITQNSRHGGTPV
jgi:hypothetical protein